MIIGNYKPECPSCLSNDVNASDYCYNAKFDVMKYYCNSCNRQFHIVVYRLPKEIEY